MTLPPPIIPPDSILNIPHLGRLQFVVQNPDHVIVQTVQWNQNPKFADTDSFVLLNNVQYDVKVNVRAAAYWLAHADRLGTSWEHDLIFTTDGNWASRVFDITARRVDTSNYSGRNITDSAAKKLVKRVMLFLDGYMPTEDAQRMIHDCGAAKRQAQIVHSRTEISRLENLLHSERKKLSDALDVGVSDLIDLQRALQRGDDLDDALYPKDDPDA